MRENSDHCGVNPVLRFRFFGFSADKDRDAFPRQVRVAFHAVEWDSGVDLAPEFIYDKCERTGASRGVAGAAKQSGD